MKTSKQDERREYVGKWNRKMDGDSESSLIWQSQILTSQPKKWT